MRASTQKRIYNNLKQTRNIIAKNEKDTRKKCVVKKRRSESETVLFAVPSDENRQPKGKKLLWKKVSGPSEREKTGKITPLNLTIWSDPPNPSVSIGSDIALAFQWMRIFFPAKPNDEIGCVHHLMLKFINISQWFCFNSFFFAFNLFSSLSCRLVRKWRCGWNPFCISDDML